MKIIIEDIAAIDWPLAIRAARWLMDRSETKDALLSYSFGKEVYRIYAKRNKSSITVRPC